MGQMQKKDNKNKKIKTKRQFFKNKKLNFQTSILPEADTTPFS